jgi:hypothetical protein
MTVAVRPRERASERAANFKSFQKVRMLSGMCMILVPDFLCGFQ